MGEAKKTQADAQTEAEVEAADVADRSSTGELWSADQEYGFVHPQLVVLDLDDCVWHPEMYTLNKIPEKLVMGKHLSSDEEECVVGVKSGRATVALHPGAVYALRKLWANGFPDNVRFATASSANTPFAVKCAHASLRALEVHPGVSVYQVLHRGWEHDDDRHLQIGRSHPLSEDKRTHFNLLNTLLDVPFEHMVFFDDCNWGDNCGNIERAFGVVTQRTPGGLQVDEFENALQNFDQERRK